MCLHLGQLKEAEGHYLRALSLTEGLEEKFATETWLGELSIAYLRQGRIEESVQPCLEAIALSRTLNDPNGEQIWRGHLGNIRQQQGRLRESEQHLRHSIAYTKEHHNHLYQAIWSGYLGVTLAMLGDIEQGRACLIESENLLRRGNHPSELVIVLCQQATVEILAEASGDVISPILQKVRDLLKKHQLSANTEPAAALKVIEEQLGASSTHGSTVSSARITETGASTHTAPD